MQKVKRNDKIIIADSNATVEFVSWGIAENKDLKASELRIGNLFQYTTDEKVVPERRGKYERIIADDIVFLDENPNVDYIKPILLTEELLQKCGAVNNNFELKNDESIEVRIKDGIAALWADDGCTEGHCLHVPCKYLHQLQNLVFTLTNEELPINLQP